MCRQVGLTVLLFCSFAAAAGEDRRLLGAWMAVTYDVQGTEHPIQGLFIFTTQHYAANVRYSASNASIDNANGNAGPYTADGKQIVFTQWVQIHVRPDDAKQPVLSRAGPDEVAGYQLEGNRLILTFPSKNRYILQRIRSR